ncbi:MAG: hypothetical protein KF802_09355 [Bdellovibrionaceae bacterium]|nr:hypothetical protein [Pseudobdellovibrionaceae bacterium]MBX3033677.1 hypothetical protein [Pseudobdellovibrionaceae bacterium]
MKKNALLMQQIGFNQDASEGAKEALLKHSEREANPTKTPSPPSRKRVRRKAASSRPVQLSFDFNKSGSGKS